MSTKELVEALKEVKRGVLPEIRLLKLLEFHGFIKLYLGKFRVTQNGENLLKFLETPYTEERRKES